MFLYMLGLEELVLREVEAKGMLDRVVISSFDHEAVKRVSELAPNVENAALFANMILDVADYQKKLPAKALHIFLPTAVRKPVMEAISKGSVVRVWTVNEIQYVEALLHIGVDAIFTDEPEKMYELLSKHNLKK